MMSDICGISAHDWEREGSLQWGSLGLPYSAAATNYRCRNCGARFVHFYHAEPDIFRAISAAGIDNDKCESHAA